MEGFGVHTSMWTMNWDREGAERAVAGALEYGVDFIEIPMLRPSEIDTAHTAALLEKSGLRAICSLGLPEQYWASVNPEGAIEYLQLAIDKTKACGAEALSASWMERPSLKLSQKPSSRLPVLQLPQLPARPQLPPRALASGTSPSPAPSSQAASSQGISSRRLSWPQALPSQRPLRSAQAQLPAPASVRVPQFRPHHPAWQQQP